MMDKPQHMARLLSWALADLMLAHPKIIVAGEDVGPKGGVYNVTAKLHERFGSARVINTLLDEQSILGLGIGAAHNGLLRDHRDPVPRLRPQCRGPDTRRGGDAQLLLERPIYQPDDHPHRRASATRRASAAISTTTTASPSSATFPGLILACPSNGADAVEMLRECVRLALEEQRVDRLPRADRALHDPRPARGRRRPVDRALCRARRGEADPARRARRPRRRHRPRHRQLRQRLLPLPPGREDPRRAARPERCG